MRFHDLLSSIKQLVDDCEDVINDGKVAVSTNNVGEMFKYVEAVKAIYTRALSILREARDVLESRGEEDKLIKYISTYYRMLTLISIPYMISILRDMTRILCKQGYENKAIEVNELINDFEIFLGTLKLK
jgi:hypothetical protein